MTLPSAAIVFTIIRKRVLIDVFKAIIVTGAFYFYRDVHMPD